MFKSEMSRIESIKSLTTELRSHADRSFKMFQDPEILKDSIMSKFDLIIDFCNKIEKV